MNRVRELNAKAALLKAAADQGNGEGRAWQNGRPVAPVMINGAPSAILNHGSISSLSGCGRIEGDRPRPCLAPRIVCPMGRQGSDFFVDASSLR
jgi:hypothetical protein